MASDSQKNVNANVSDEEWFEQKWSSVDTSKPLKAIVLREASGGTVEKSGRLTLNCEASDMADENAEAWNLEDVANSCVRFWVNAKERTVAAIPVPSGAPGAERVARNMERHTYVLHLGHVFEGYRSLRPVGKQNVIITQQFTPQGKPYMLIDLNTGMTVNTTTRAGSKEHQKRQEAKARREARQEAKQKGATRPEGESK